MNDFLVEITQPAQVTGNFEELQAELDNMMQAYAGLEVNESNIAERKKDVATLRKIKAAIDDKRKATKKEYEKPLKAFETKCKDLISIIDKEVDRINNDLSVYEQKRIAEKRERISEIYREQIGEYEEFLPLEVIRSPKWDNKGCTENKIISDIQLAKMQVVKELDSIRELCPGYVDECIEAYKKSGNRFAAAIARYHDLQSARERAEADLKAEKVATLPTVQEEPKKPVESKKEWLFAVYSEEDANSVRAYLNMFDIKHREESI